MANIEDLTQDDIDKMESALDRYKKENEKFRTQRDEYKAQAEAGEANEAFKNRALQAEAKLKLTALGVKDTDRLVKYIDYTHAAFDDEGNITGLDEQIESLKNDFSEVFDPKRRVGGKADAAADTPPATPKSTTEMQVAKLFGR
jgi:hypothetical protein